MIFQLKQQTNDRLFALTTCVLVILVFLAVLGGLPSPDEVNLFVVGLSVLIAITIGFGFLAWHLLVRPLAKGLRRNVTYVVTASEYQLLAIGMFAVHILLTVGGVWDEIWHVRYGLAFGEDFFWRPHILMYSGFLGALLLGMYAWYAIFTRAKGTLQQRFRANKLLGILALFGAFMAYALPADPIWHAIYGKDLTAWSIPHVLLILIWIIVAVIGIALQMTLVKKRQWASFLKMNANDIIPLFVGAFVNLMVLVMLGTEWEYFNITGRSALQELSYPEWLFPVFIVFTATFTGILVNVSTRRYGAATLIGILTVIIRLALVHTLDHVVKSANPWLLTLGPLIMIDVFYAFHVWDKQRLSIGMMAFAATAGMTMITLPLLDELYVYPTIDLSNILLIVFGVFIASSIAAWLANTIASFAFHQQASNTDSEQATSRGLYWLTPTVFVLLWIFIIYLVVTAQAPVLS